MEVTTPEQWWAEIETILMQAYVGLGCSLSTAKHLALLAHQKYLEMSQWFLYEDVIPTLEVLGNQGWEHAILVRKEDARATYAYPDLSFIPGFLSQQMAAPVASHAKEHRLGASD